MKTGGYIVFLIALFMFNACEKVIDWNENNKDLPLLVVEGRITNERIRQKVILSSPAQDVNGKFNPVSGAFVIRMVF